MNMSCSFAHPNYQYKHDSDFSQYRIKWNADVESYLRQKHEIAQRRQVSPQESDEDIDVTDERKPIPAPKINNIA